MKLIISRVFAACAVTGVLALGVPAVHAQQSDGDKAKQHAKQAGEETKDAGKAVGTAAKETGKAAADSAKAVGHKVKKLTKKHAPADATGKCGDGTWTSASSRADACTDHNGLAAVVCPGALCK